VRWDHWANAFCSTASNSARSKRLAPANLTRHLLFSVIAYRVQADRFGDLDHQTKQVLDRTVAKKAGAITSTRLASFDQKRTELTPGTVLVREWDRRSQRVMVMADGFAWNGRTYEQPPILDRALFDAVLQKAFAQWSHRTLLRNKSDHLLTGLLFDDAGHRMVPTHATKAGIRYRYYVSTPVLHGEAKTASAGSASRVPAADIEEVIVNSLKDHLAIQQAKSTTNPARIDDRGALAQLVARITVHKDKLTVRLKSDDAADASNSADGPLLTITWQKQPSRRSRQILLPHKSSRSQVRPQQSERRARLVSAIARGRRWLDEVVSSRVTSVDELCAREKCSVRQVNMTISLAFLAPNLVKAAVEGRPPRGIGIERLRDLPTEWSRQFEALGLNPE
jgi:hypothetical protein